MHIDNIIIFVDKANRRARSAAAVEFFISEVRKNTNQLLIS